MLGVIALPELKRELFPEFASSKVQIRIAYPGASAEEVEEAIIQRLEERFEKEELKTIFNGERAGMLIVNKTRAQDSLVVVDAVKRFIKCHLGTPCQGDSTLHAQYAWICLVDRYRGQ